MSIEDINKNPQWMKWVNENTDSEKVYLFWKEKCQSLKIPIDFSKTPEEILNSLIFHRGEHIVKKLNKILTKNKIEIQPVSSITINELGASTLNNSLIYEFFESYAHYVSKGDVISFAEKLKNYSELNLGKLYELLNEHPGNDIEINKESDSVYVLINTPELLYKLSPPSWCTAYDQGLCENYVERLRIIIVINLKDDTQRVNGINIKIVKNTAFIEGHYDLMNHNTNNNLTHEFTSLQFPTSSLKRILHEKNDSISDSFFYTAIINGYSIEEIESFITPILCTMNHKVSIFGRDINLLNDILSKFSKRARKLFLLNVVCQNFGFSNKNVCFLLMDWLSKDFGNELNFAFINNISLKNEKEINKRLTTEQVLTIISNPIDPKVSDFGLFDDKNNERRIANNIFFNYIFSNFIDSIRKHHKDEIIKNKHQIHDEWAVLFSDWFNWDKKALTELITQQSFNVDTGAYVANHAEEYGLLEGYGEKIVLKYVTSLVNEQSLDFYFKELSNRKYYRLMIPKDLTIESYLFLKYCFRKNFFNFSININFNVLITKFTMYEKLTASRENKIEMDISIAFMLFIFSRVMVLNEESIKLMHEKMMDDDQKSKIVFNEDAKKNKNKNILYNIIYENNILLYTKCLFMNHHILKKYPDYINNVINSPLKDAFIHFFDFNSHEYFFLVGRHPDAFFLLSNFEKVFNYENLKDNDIFKNKRDFTMFFKELLSNSKNIYAIFHSYFFTKKSGYLKTEELYEIIQYDKSLIDVFLTVVLEYINENFNSINFEIDILKMLTKESFIKQITLRKNVPKYHKETIIQIMKKNKMGFFERRNILSKIDFT
jgi:hypothetical protein